MKLIHLIFILPCFSAISAKNDDADNLKFMQDLMLSSKWAGVCGTYKQMTAFQDVTKMNGGDEFIRRFINTEMARLDMTQQQLIDICNKATNTYSEFYNLSLNEFSGK